MIQVLYAEQGMYEARDAEDAVEDCLLPSGRKGFGRMVELST